MIISCSKITDDSEDISDLYSVILNKTELSVMENWSVQLEADLIDQNGNIQEGINFLWKSSNTNIAVIDSTGNVYAFSNGSANITAEYDGIISEPCVVTVSRQDSLFAEVNGNSVTIWHTYSFRNCASSVDLDFQMNDHQITVTEIELNPPMANCICLFDFSISIDELDSGDYTAEIIGIEYSGEIVSYGTVEFTIEGNLNQDIPSVTSQYQSDCYSLD